MNCIQAVSKNISKKDKKMNWIQAVHDMSMGEIRLSSNGIPHKIVDNVLYCGRSDQDISQLNFWSATGLFLQDLKGEWSIPEKYRHITWIEAIDADWEKVQFRYKDKDMPRTWLSLSSDLLDNSIKYVRSYEYRILED